MRGIGYRREVCGLVLLVLWALVGTGCAGAGAHRAERIVTVPPAPVVEPPTPAMPPIAPESPPTGPGSTAQPPMLEEEFVLAGIRPGMNLDEVRQAFPALVVERGEDEEIWWLTGRKEGFITVVAERAVTVVLKHPAEGAAPRNVRVGDPMSQLLTAYGRPEREVPGKLTYVSPSGRVALSVHYQGEPLSPASTVYSVGLSPLVGK